MLYCLMDNRARTATELAVIAEVSPSTASVHLNRLKAERLVRVAAQGKHRYYSLDNTDVARVLERLSVLAGGSRTTFVSNTPVHLRSARTCYDHIAGALGVALHDRLVALEWISSSYDLTRTGESAFSALRIDIAGLRTRRRRFAFPCLDWSERRSHLGGGIGAALLHQALKHRWVMQELDSRALTLTPLGRREMRSRFGVELISR
jgi:hypothetical protein